MSFRQGARQFFERRGAPLPYDAEVEYLRRNNGNGIAAHTGVYISDNNFVIEFDCKVDSVAVGWTGPFWTYLNEQTEVTRVIAYNLYLNRFYAGYRRVASSGNVIYGVDWTVRSLFRLEYEKLTVTPHGGIPAVYALYPPSSTVDGGLEMVVAGNLCDVYYYGFRIFHNGNLVLNYVPVKKGGVGYFFDTVSMSLVGMDSSASDQYIIGPDKS